MEVYRICKANYSDDLSGTGAALYGGRWNPKGLPLLYTSEGISLAILEYLAHNMHVFRTSEIALLKLAFDKKSKISNLEVEDLPQDWNVTSYMPQGTQRIGQDFINSRKTYGLRVPSVLVPGDTNLLLNSQHPDHSKLKIVEKIIPFKIDERLSPLR